MGLLSVFQSMVTDIPQREKVLREEEEEGKGE